MNLRRYEARDRDALIALWRRAFPDDPPHNEPSAVLDAKLAVDDLVFVAEEGNRLVGACLAGYDGHRGWLYSMAVAAERRREGIGAALVERAVAALGELGCVKVNLQVRASNEAVAAFYETLGFAREERTSLGRLLGTPATGARDDAR